MRLKRFLAAGAAIVVLSGAAGSAQGASLVAVFTGVVTQSVSDMTFGSANLVGMNYTATYTFDPAVGTTSIYSPGGGVFDYLRSGYGPASPIRSLSLTINGHTDVMAFQSDIYPYGSIERVNYPASPSGGLYMGAQGSRYVASPVGGEATDYHTAGSSFASPTLIGFDMADPWDPVGGTGLSGFLRQVQNAGRGYDQAYDIKGSVTSARVFDGAAVGAAAPEPATWGLMIMGFGVAGTALRRRRAPALA